MKRQFSVGDTLYDADGEKLGSVVEDHSASGYLVVEKGLIFLHDYYVPLDAITRTDAKGVHLNVRKDQIKSLGWDQPPAPGARKDTGLHTGEGVEQTQRTDLRGAQGARDERDIRVPVHEEELVAGKRAEEIGRVHISKDVVNQQETVSAPVTHEEVHVERVPVTNDAPLDEHAFQERDIEVPVMGEEMVVGKQARTAEELRVRKDAVTEEARATDTVRKERVKIDGADEPGEEVRDDLREDRRPQP
jgi:uncharacterized protein (TIGR02271 family)